MARSANLTADKVMDLAQDMIMERGWHAISFRDIADALGIKSASVHYYFKTKSDLGVAVVRRYAEARQHTLDDITSSGKSPDQKLKLFAGAFRDRLVGDRNCLSGVLGAERRGLPDEVAREVQAFFAGNLAWLEQVFREGKRDGVLTFPGTVTAQAEAYMALMEGTLILLSGGAAPRQFDRLLSATLASLTK